MTETADHTKTTTGPTATNYLFPLDGSVRERTERFGGKGQSLDRLVRAGFKVPPAWCLTAEAYHEFMEETGIAQWIGTLESIDQEACTRIRELIYNTPLPEKLREQVIRVWEALGGGVVAVRSSALREDGLEQSWAGQHDSFLYVDDEDSLSTAVQHCWGSLWTARAHAYREQRTGSGLETEGIAVVIQAMIDPDTSGVAFSADPVTGDPERIVIDACWGAGEGVVSGQVVCDNWVVAATQDRFLEKNIRTKPGMVVRRDSGGTRLTEVAQSEAYQPSLTDEQVFELTREILAVREHYGRAMDVEWALADGQFWLLQARPITFRARPQDQAIYACVGDADDNIRNNAMFSRLDTGEIMTGLMSPLGISFCQFYQYNVHGPGSKRIGLLDIGNPDHYMGYMLGQVYLNVSCSALLLTQCPPTRDQMMFTERYATDDLDLSNYQNPYGEPPRGLAYVKSSLYWLGCQLRNSIMGKRLVREAVDLRRREMARFLKLDLATMSLPELDRELERIDHYFLRGCEIYMPFFLQSFALYDALAELCEEHLGEEGAGLQNRIKASMNNLRTIEITRGILNLAETVKEQPELHRLMLETPVEELIDTLRDDPHSRAFWEGPFADFLFEFGSRGRQEFNLSLPRWYDDPTYLLQLIRMYLTNDIDLEARLATVGDQRAEDTERVLSQLPFGTRMKFRMVIGMYSRLAVRREVTRPTFITQTWFYRCILMEILRRMEKHGIATREDLPYVDFNRFRDYVAGLLTAEEAFSRQLLDENRRLHEYHQRMKEPPMSLIGGHVPELDLGEVDLADSDNGPLRGLGASPGTVVARARVITNLEQQAEQLQQGEILVAPFTDASWTPLFALAGGVVTDIGSLLSHSSIVSREFGIPAVVNAENATRRIRTGDLVSLDGNAGIVKVER